MNFLVGKKDRYPLVAKFHQKISMEEMRYLSKFINRLDGFFEKCPFRVVFSGGPFCLRTFVRSSIVNPL